MKFHLKHILGCASFLLQGLVLAGQIIPFKSYSIQVAGHNEKLQALYSTTDGYLLAGTQSGLFTFNGNEFRAVAFADTAIRYKSITAIHQDAKNRVW